MRSIVAHQRSLIAQKGFSLSANSSFTAKFHRLRISGGNSSFFNPELAKTSSLFLTSDQETNHE
jgi:hypothetical protein